MKALKIRHIAAAAVAAVAVAAVPAHAGTAAKTKHPVVLVHGFIGFDSILGVVNYFYQIPGALRDEGATVYIASVNPSQTTEFRGEELNKQLDAWKAASPWYNKIQKFNLIGHSHGGPTVRYSAATRSDIASVSTMSGTHYGSKVADEILKGTTPDGGFDQAATAGLKLIGWLTGNTNYKSADLKTALKALSSVDAERFNQDFPAGRNAEYQNGQYFYSYAGNLVKTNGWDISDAILAYTGKYYGTTANDGLVSPEEAKWGKQIDLALPWNHLDEINQVLGSIGKGAPDPKAYYVNIVNRLKAKGV
ncbi:lipase [Aquabacterium soli]|uniref:Lipase n=1 Tax=Aquabacterium soli TaxID=2493092 RepID=A0A426VIA2_9BURK|nr:alpha/beta fold hydrolase [Aquabacterium soli]RRS06360.1 lipase [Aquabacterium soli]